MWSVRLSCTHPNVAAVVGVNHAGARVDEVLPGARVAMKCFPRERGAMRP